MVFGVLMNPSRSIGLHLCACYTAEMILEKKPLKKKPPGGERNVFLKGDHGDRYSVINIELLNKHINI